MKTSKKDFDIFKKECERWIEFFGLKDYSVRILHENTEGGGEANIWTDEFQKCATIKQSIDLKHECLRTKEEIKRAAFHEVCHLLLSDLYFKATCRYLSDSELDGTEHAIIQRLENLVFEKLS